MATAKRRVQGPSSGKKRKTAGTKKRKAASSDGNSVAAHDVFEVDDIEADEDVHAYRYDDVEDNEYQLPEDFEDEEIDEDEAFNSEDERLYGHLFDDSNREDEDEDEDDDDDDASLSEEGQREAAYDVLQSDDPSDEEETWPVADEAGDFLLDARREHREGIKHSLTESDTALDEGGEDEDETAVAVPRHGRHKQLLTEAYPESVFHISAQGHNENGGEISVEDLIAGLGENRSKLGAARKSLEKLSKKVSPLDAPLPGPIQERQERKAAYDESKKDIQKWMPLVKAHREAPTLHLTSNKNDVHKSTTISSVAAKHKPGNSMELEVAAMLEAANAHTASAVAESEDALAMRMLSAEEAKARREELAKQRALLFYHEVKAKRLKKIKSKDYRRRLKKAEKKKAGAVSGEEGMLLLGDDELQQQREEAEYARAKERLTLKHKNTSRFIRRAIKRGSQHAPDEGTREAIAEQLRLGEEIRKKVHSFKDNDSGSSSESDSSDDERENARISRKLESAARDILDDNDSLGEEKGLMSLPFMKRSMEKKKKAAADQARDILGETEANEKSTGRLRFGNRHAGEKHNDPEVNTDELVTEDEDEDAEAKYTRLTQKNQGNSAGKSKSSESHDFVQSSKFEGVKEGYIFTNGSRGIGYYSDSGAQKPTAASSKQKQKDAKETNAHVKQSKTSLQTTNIFSQEDLIKKAFAGDDVVNEFKKSKREEVEGELPKEEIPGELPGWGTWSRQKKEPAWVQEAKSRAEAKKQAAARARKDAGMEYVVISEKWDSKNAKYKTQSVPYPFNAKETYERSLRQPLGRDYNTIDSFRNLTRPSIIKDNGVIIEPLKYSAAVGKHNANQPMKNRSSIIQIRGGMPKRISKKKK